jgi:uncharacterized surface protein with fasciclin (FAS1) repeats
MTWRPWFAAYAPYSNGGEVTIRGLPAALAIGLLLGAPAAWAQKGVPATTVIVGGFAMSSGHDFIDNLAQSADHKTFLSLLEHAGMQDALQAHGPFTVFAPTDAAFAALPPGKLDTLRRPENKAALQALLGIQIVPGNYSSARLRYLLRIGKGQTELDTVGGGKLVVTTNGPTNLVLRSPNGMTSNVILYDAKQSNGVLFVTDRVLRPG